MGVIREDMFFPKKKNRFFFVFTFPEGQALCTGKPVYRREPRSSFDDEPGAEEVLGYVNKLSDYPANVKNTLTVLKEICNAIPKKEHDCGSKKGITASRLAGILKKHRYEP